jgi:glyoxylase-like metal-dependent hydrolase (beta-lactamase superfamily II)
MTAIPFVPPLDDVTYGVAADVAADLRRVLAENPSKFTYRGTGTYVVGRGEVAVIDPGPDLPAHRDALAAVLKGERVAAIVVTHCHADHSPLAAWLAAETGAPTYALGPHGEVSDDPDDVIDESDDEPAETDPKEPNEPKEGVDTAFAPAVTVADGEVFARGPGWTLEAVATPGHTSNHLCVAWREQRALFSGDHIMGWSTTVVSPPDGDMAAYMASVRKVQGRRDEVLWPTHGNPITNPEPFLAAYLAHRLDREAQVLAQVRGGVSSITEMVATLYADVDPKLHRAASRSVLAHLVKLVGDGMVALEGDDRARVRSVYRAV